MVPHVARALGIHGCEGRMTRPAGAASGGILGGGAVSGLLSGINIGSVITGIGNIFANGFDLSCYNNSYTPSRSAQSIQARHQPYFNRLFADLDNAQGLDQVNETYVKLATAVQVCSKLYDVLLAGNEWVRCSEKGIQVIIDWYDQIEQAFIEATRKVKEQYNVVSVGSANRPSEWVYEGVNYTKTVFNGSHTITYTVYEVQSKSVLGGIFGGGSDDDNGNVQEASFLPKSLKTTGKWLGGLAIAGFGISKAWQWFSKDDRF